MANHQGRLVELATAPGADSAEVPAVRGLPPRKGPVPLALIGSKRRVYGLKRHVPDFDQFDDRYRSAVAEKDDADVACRRQRKAYGSELDGQARRGPLAPGLHKRP